MTDQEFPTDEERAKQREWFDRWNARVERIAAMDQAQLRGEVEFVVAKIQEIVDPFLERDDAEWHSYEWSINRWVWFALASEDAVVERAKDLEPDSRSSGIEEATTKLHTKVEEMVELFFGHNHENNLATADWLEFTAQGRLDLVRPTGKVYVRFPAPQFSKKGIRE